MSAVSAGQRVPTDGVRGCPCNAAAGCPRSRTYSGRRPAARTVGVHRRLSMDGHGRAEPVGAAGGTVTVAVRVGDGLVRVEVTDRSGPEVPELHRAGRDAEGGRGLQLVAGLAARWGWRRRGGQTVTWFELRHPLSERDR